MFENIVGNDHIKEYLNRMVETQSIGNSLMFAGPDGIGKSLFAVELAKLIICQDDPHGVHRHKIETGNHPDIRHFRPEGKSGIHSIESMRQFSEDVYLHPYEAKWKVYIIHDAHRMMTYSANALLKTFEEPSKQSVIILLTHAPEALLPTVLSRCRTLHFHRVTDREIAMFLTDNHHCPTDEARRYAEMSHGSISKALELMHDGGDPLRERLLSFLAKGRVSTYSELTDFVKEMSAQIDLSKKEAETEIKQELLAGASMDDMSATQKNTINKEVEGAVAMRQLHGAHELLDIVLSWYRDVQLLYLGGDNRYIINKDYEPAMQEMVIKEEPLALEEVQEMIKNVRTSLARSTSLSLCLENLFLKLNFL
ncbi:MAG: DNA polymerase III subunit [Chlamydiota bacterium]